MEKNVVMSNKEGLHARPASELVALVKDFEGEVELIKDGVTANGKSIFNVMALGVAAGDEITVRVSGGGKDAEELQEIVDFFNNLE